MMKNRGAVQNLGSKKSKGRHASLSGGKHGYEGRLASHDSSSRPINVDLHHMILPLLKVKAQKLHHMSLLPLVVEFLDLLYMSPLTLVMELLDLLYQYLLNSFVQ